MSRLFTLGRAMAIATVVAGILLFSFAVQGVTRVDTRLELAASQQQAAPKFADCPLQPHHRGRGRDRQDV